MHTCTPRVLSLYCIDCDCIEFEIRELDSAEGRVGIAKHSGGGCTSGLAYSASLIGSR